MHCAIMPERCGFFYESVLRAPKTVLLVTSKLITQPGWPRPSTIYVEKGESASV